MAGKRIVVPNYMPALDLNGGPVAGAKMFFWENETTTLKAIYTSAALSVAHPNPVVANAAGVFPSIFADEDEEFSVAITDANDNPIVGLRNRDNIRPSLAFLDGIDVPVSDPMANVLAQETLEAARTEMGLALPVQPNSGEFGAFTTPTLTTATLLAAFTYAMANDRPIELSGAYTINGPITPASAVEGVELHIILRDDVTITVDAGATPFNRVFYAESTTVQSHSIGGPGSLVIDCNDKAAAGIWLRHTAATTGGTIFINAPVHVKNLYGATGFSTVAGIIIFGRYKRIVMRSPTVEDASRADVSGECSGITCSGFDGEVEMYSPVVSRIDYGPGTGDADCIKCFGRASGTTNNRREGSVRIYDPIMEDGQARLYKDQCGDTIIYRPIARRYKANMVSGASSVDFDFQYGGGLVLNAQVEYYSAAGVSPLSASHSVFAFQQKIDNAVMSGSARNTTIFSDVAVPRIALVIEGGFASTTEIDGLKMIPFGGLATTMITECLMEFDVSQVLAKSTATSLSVINVDAPSTSPVMGYRGYAALDSGTATAGGATTLTNSAETWTVDQWVGHELRITSGTGAGQSRLIASNTATILTVTGAWTVNPDATSVYTISASATSKLSVRVDRCSTSLAITGNGTRAISDIAGNVLRSYKSFEIGDNPGYRNWYRNMDICLKKMRAGTKFSLYLDDSSFVDADFSTPVTVPWGTTGTLELICDGVSNTNTTSNDASVKAFLDAAAPNSWFSLDGGLNFRTAN